MNPKISVIIPVYNGGLFVEKTIRSVLAQEYPAHEIIVIDDGSTDNTPSVLEGFRDRILIKRTSNGGAARARNAGVNLSTGDYLAFLDADDIWFRHRLRANVAYIKKYPDIGFFCSNYAVRYPELDRRLVRHYSVIPDRDRLNFNEPLKENPFKLLLYGNFVGTPSGVIVKKSVVDQTKLFKSGHIIVEDLGFFIDMSMRTNFVLIKDILFYKRTHGANISSQKILMYLNHKMLLMSIIDSNKRYIESCRLSGDCARALAQLNYRLGNLYFETGDKKKAFSLFAEGRKSDSRYSNLLEFLWVISKKTIRSFIKDICGFGNPMTHLQRKIF